MENELKTERIKLEIKLSNNVTVYRQLYTFNCLTLLASLGGVVFLSYFVHMTILCLLPVDTVMQKAALAEQLFFKSSFSVSKKSLRISPNVPSNSGSSSNSNCNQTS